MDIIKIMHKLIAENPELSIYGGVGYCGYGSILLQAELERIHVPSVLLYGKALADTKLGKHAREGQKSNILAIDSTAGDLYSITKEKYMKAGNRFSQKAGHVVILINDTVYDISSRQFGINQVYSYADFMETWSVVSTITLEVDKSKDFYTNNLKIIEKLAIAVEAIVEVRQSKVYPRTKETPRFLSW